MFLAGSGVVSEGGDGGLGGAGVEPGVPEVGHHDDGDEPLQLPPLRARRLRLAHALQSIERNRDGDWRLTGNRDATAADGMMNISAECLEFTSAISTLEHAHVFLSIKILVSQVL